jgi:uncharacterized protein (TIGR00369 family)
MTSPASSKDHFRKLERAYNAAPINAFYSPTLRVSEGSAELILDIQRKMHHAAGAVHGSVYFKVLDDAAFFAANSLVDDVFLLTTSFTVYMLRPVSQGRLKAQGWITHKTGRLFFAESKLEDQDGNPVARGSGTFMRSQVRLTTDVGYV